MSHVTVSLNYNSFIHKGQGKNHLRSSIFKLKSGACPSSASVGPMRAFWGLAEDCSSTASLRFSMSGVL